MQITTTCPAYCHRVHQEAPGEVVVHETSPVRVSQIPSLVSPGQPLLLQVSQADDDLAPRMHLGECDFDLYGAERLLAELALKVQVMQEAQARLAAGLVAV